MKRLSAILILLALLAGYQYWRHIYITQTEILSDAHRLNDGHDIDKGRLVITYSMTPSADEIEVQASSITSKHANVPSDDPVNSSFNDTSKVYTAATIMSAKLDGLNVADILSNIVHLRMQDIHNQAVNQHAIAEQIDLLTELLLHQPEQLSNAATYLNNLAIGNKDFRIITSSLRAANPEFADYTLANLASIYASANNPQSQQNLLALMSEMTSLGDGSNTHQTLLELSLRQDISVATKLASLNMLQASATTPNDKLLIVRQLSNIYETIDAKNELETELIVPEILRFAEPSKRIEIAIEMLSKASKQPARLAMLDNISSENVQPNIDIKIRLMQIAEDLSDPISDEAKETLLNGFNLTSNEKLRLKDSTMR